LAKEGITESVGEAEFAIEKIGRHIKDANFNPAIKKLFEFHTPTLGVGLLDYLPPIRYYPAQGVGDINSAGSDQQLRSIVPSFHRGWNDTSKFSTFKTFVVDSIVNDNTASRDTGISVDSLKTFRETFDRFFSPKQFLGPKKNPTIGQFEVLVQTPFGRHDIDILSDGEKEVLNVLGYLYQFRHLESIFLWDTPESHLNAALESRLYQALLGIVPRNQIWLSTHSLELIGSVPPESLFVLRQVVGEVILDRPNDSDRCTRIAIYRELGASVGLQLVSSLVVFVEGKEAASDKRILDRLIGESNRAVNFVAGNDCEAILAAGTRANQLLEKACPNGDFLAVVDRDYRDDAEAERIEKQHSGRVFVWGVHEIENLFLQPNVMYATLVFHDQLGSFKTEDDIREALRGVTNKHKDWIAADWVRWEICQQVKNPSGYITETEPLKSVQDFGQRVRDQAQQVAAVSDIDSQYDARLLEIERLLKSDKWFARLPGKQILKWFLTEHTRLTQAEFLPTAVSAVIDKTIPIPEIDRLKRILHVSIGGDKKGKKGPS